MPTRRKPAGDDGPPGKHVVLILSADPVAAALLGALVETLGYLVRFYQSSEKPDDAIRRERPSVAMVNCNDPSLMNAELFGRARMRGISVVIFGARVALAQVRELAAEYNLDTLIMPASIETLDATLQQAVQKYC